MDVRIIGELVAIQKWRKGGFLGEAVEENSRSICGSK